MSVLKREVRGKERDRDEERERERDEEARRSRREVEVRYSGNDMLAAFGPRKPQTRGIFPDAVHAFAAGKIKNCHCPGECRWESLKSHNLCQTEAGEYAAPRFPNPKHQAHQTINPKP